MKNLQRKLINFSPHARCLVWRKQRSIMPAKKKRKAAPKKRKVAKRKPAPKKKKAAPKKRKVAKRKPAKRRKRK